MRALLPPTLVTLTSLVPFRRSPTCWPPPADRPLDPVEPRLLRDRDRPAVQLPDGTVVRDPAGVAGMTHPSYEVVRPVTSSASVLLADNPAPMTLDGTNTWLLRAPGSESCIVVDPGPVRRRVTSRRSTRRPGAWT